MRENFQVMSDTFADQAIKKNFYVLLYTSHQIWNSNCFKTLRLERTSVHTEYCTKSHNTETKLDKNKRLFLSLTV
jgi:hypothetical protein